MLVARQGAPSTASSSCRRWSCGVPVLSEWPLARRPARGRGDGACPAWTTCTFVGLQGRSSPTFRWLADLVSEGFVGGSALRHRRGVFDRMGHSGVSRTWSTRLTASSGATMLTIAFGHAIDPGVDGRRRASRKWSRPHRDPAPPGSPRAHRAGRSDDRRGPDRDLGHRGGRGGPVRPPPWRRGIGCRVLSDHRRHGGEKSQITAAESPARRSGHGAWHTWWWSFSTNGDAAQRLRRLSRPGRNK